MKPLDPRTLRWASKRLKRMARKWYNSVTPGTGLRGFFTWECAEILLNEARVIEKKHAKKSGRK